MIKFKFLLLLSVLALSQAASAADYVLIDADAEKKLWTKKGSVQNVKTINIFATFHRRTTRWNVTFDGYQFMADIDCRSKKFRKVSETSYYLDKRVTSVTKGNMTGWLKFKESQSIITLGPQVCK